MIKKAILKEAGVLLLVAIMVLSTFTVAETVNHETSSVSTENQEMWMPYTSKTTEKQQKSVISTDKEFSQPCTPSNPEKLTSAGGVYLRYDDGEPNLAIGSTNPPVWMAILLTPAELGPFNNTNITAATWYHQVTNVSIPKHNYTLKIYEGNATAPITELVNESDNATGVGWETHNLTAPFKINAAKYYWIIVKVNASNATKYNDKPLAFDTNPASYYPGKSNWFHNASAPETQFSALLGVTGSWCLRVKIPNGTDTVPPVTTCSLAGTQEGSVYTSNVTVTLTAQDWVSGVNYTKYKINSGSWNTYSAPFTVSQDGAYNISFYSKDKAGNNETKKNVTFTLKHSVYLRYDDGAPNVAIGSKTPPLWMAILLTPAELGPFNNLNITEITWYHIVTNESIPKHNYTLKIYEGNTTSPITELVNETDNATGEGWENHTLSSPLKINATKNYWIVVKVNASNATKYNDYPLPFDTNLVSYYPGKSNWYHNGLWPETHFYALPKLNGSWCLRVKIHNGTDNVPPVTTCRLIGTKVGSNYTSDVIVNLTAQDWSSGVGQMKYKMDTGSWNNYSAPFTVTQDGAHTVHFYSVDRRGNTETEKTSTFTIQHPCYLKVTSIKGGLGVSATINNTGTSDLTGVKWNITLDGGFILIGKTKTGTIDLKAGEEKTIKSFVIGLGKPTITVEAGCAEKTATGTVLLFFVLGVS